MEKWKPIKGYESIYEVSSYGRIKSLKFGLEKILKLTINSRGYQHVTLYLNSKGKNLKVHQLVAIAFLGHTPCGMKWVVNHKDLNPLNNRENNLEIITQRENANLKHIKSSSIYTGVTFDKKRNKWMAKTYLNYKFVFIGYFDLEKEAGIAYQNWLVENVINLKRKNHDTITK